MPLHLALQFCTEIACSSSQPVFFGAKMFTIDPKRHPPGHTPGVQRLGEGQTLSGLVSHCSFYRLPGLSFYLQSPAHRHHCHLPPPLSFLTCLNSACIIAGLSATATREGAAEVFQQVGRKDTKPEPHLPGGPVQEQAEEGSLVLLLRRMGNEAGNSASSQRAQPPGASCATLPHQPLKPSGF